MIPPKKNHKLTREYDKYLYKDLNKGELFVNLLKQHQRIASRYEKTA